MNFAKFLRTSFLQNTPRRLLFLLKMQDEKFDYLKIDLTYYCLFVFLIYFGFFLVSKREVRGICLGKAYFHVNFAKFFRTTIFWNTCKRLLLYFYILEFPFVLEEEEPRIFKGLCVSQFFVLLRKNKHVHFYIKICLSI